MGRQVNRNEQNPDWQLTPKGNSQHISVEHPKGQPAPMGTNDKSPDWKPSTPVKMEGGKQQTTKGITSATDSYCIFMLCTEQGKVCFLEGRVVLGTWSVWPSLSPKVWWIASKPPFSKWDERKPNGRDFLAKERSGFLYFLFKPCALLGTTNTLFSFSSIFLLL